MLLALVIIFSVGAIQANEVNMTDSSALNSIDDDVVQIEETSEAEPIISNSSSDSASCRR